MPARFELDDYLDRVTYPAVLDTVVHTVRATLKTSARRNTHYVLLIAEGVRSALIPRNGEI